jgi:hypothetical protein
VGRGRSRLRIANCCLKAAFSNATSLWPAKMRSMNRNILKTALSMTRYFAFTVAENQSHRLPYEFWRRTGVFTWVKAWFGKDGKAKTVPYVTKDFKARQLFLTILQTPSE